MGVEHRRSISSSPSSSAFSERETSRRSFSKKPEEVAERSNGMGELLLEEDNQIYIHRREENGEMVALMGPSG